jgi:beta-galactosidase
VPFSTTIRKRALGRYEPEGYCALDEALGSLSTAISGDRPLGFEEMDQGYGYALYRAHLSGPRPIERCVLHNCSDRAVVLVNGQVVRSLNSPETDQPFAFDLHQETNRVDILVENQGRVNFGEKMDAQRKGLGALIFDKHAHCQIESWSLPLDPLPDLPWSADLPPVDDRAPAFLRFTFDYHRREPGFEDSFLRIDGWGKGVAWLNGRNLGRFWEIGPQKALYVPGPWLVDGLNEVVIFETEGRRGVGIELTDQPDLG